MKSCKYIQRSRDKKALPNRMNRNGRDFLYVFIHYNSRRSGGNPVRSRPVPRQGQSDPVT